MRIIGEIPHPNLKITVFQMNNRLSVQFETGQYTQIYKIREQEHIRNFSDIQKYVDQNLLDDVLPVFQQMHQVQTRAMNRFLPQEEGSAFEEII